MMGGIGREALCRERERTLGARNVRGKQPDTPFLPKEFRFPFSEISNICSSNHNFTYTILIILHSQLISILTCKNRFFALLIYGRCVGGGCYSESDGTHKHKHTSQRQCENKHTTERDAIKLCHY